MINQGRYIIQAFLILAVGTVILFPFKNFSFSDISNPSTSTVEPWCGTQNDPPMTPSIEKGKLLFNSNYGACHTVYGEMAGPGLRDFEERGPWKDRKKLYEWVRNPAKFKLTDPYTQALGKQSMANMQAFPTLSDEEIDAIADYINYVSRNLARPVANADHFTSCISTSLL